MTGYPRINQNENNCERDSNQEKNQKTRKGSPESCLVAHPFFSPVLCVLCNLKVRAMSKIRDRHRPSIPRSLGPHTTRQKPRGIRSSCQRRVAAKQHGAVKNVAVVIRLGVFVDGFGEFCWVGMALGRVEPYPSELGTIVKMKTSPHRVCRPFLSTAPSLPRPRGSNS